MIVKCLLFIIVGFVMAMPTTTFSQSLELKSAKFKGIAVDREDALITKALVVIEGTDRKWNLETDGEGEINLELPAGKYNFTVEAPGFKKLVLTDFCITAGAMITYKFRMEIRDCDDCYMIAPENPKPVLPSAQPHNSFNRK